MMRSSRRKRLLGKIGLATLVLVISLSIVEVALRVAGHDLNPSDLWRFDSTFGWTIDPDTQLVDKVNSRGFRHRDVSPEKPPNTKRLLMLGDSFTEAVTFPYAQIFAGLVETRLNRGVASRWEVISLGVGGWGTAQQLIALKTVGMPLRPDVVVLQVFPFNDLCNNTIGLAHTCSTQDDHRPYFVLEDDRLRATHVSPWRTFLRNRMVLFGMVENILRPNVSQSEALPYWRRNTRAIGLEHEGPSQSLLPDNKQAPVVRHGWQTTERLVREIRDVLGAIPLLVVVVPYSRTFGHQWQAFSANRNGVVADHGTNRVVEICHGLGLPTVDVRSKISNSHWGPEELFLPSDGHFSAVGHSLVAEWIQSAFIDMGVVSVHACPQWNEIDLLADERPEGISLSGLSGLTVEDDRRWRLGLGPQTRIVLSLPGGQTRLLRIEMINLIPRQEVSVWINGSEVERLSFGHADERVSRSFPWTSRPGANEIRLVYRDWSGREEIYFSPDDRPIAINVVRLVIR